MQRLKRGQGLSGFQMEKVKKVPNPCMGICVLDIHDLCIACKRSGIEIAYWGSYSDEKKLEIWKQLPEREVKEI